MTQSYQDTDGEPIFLDVGSGSAVRSHTSYDPHVEAVCHHSGRYLTRGETYPQWRALLREQHDFPGLPELDRVFARAAHAFEHQHPVWNRPGVRGIALMLAGLLLLGALIPLFARRDQINGVLTTPGLIEFVLVYTLLAAGAATGLGLLIWGASLLVRRQALYHRDAAGLPPAVADFPLLNCAYDMAAWEHVEIDVGNAQAPPHLTAKPSTLTVRLYPNATDIVANYLRYRQAYQQHGVGAYLHAGTIALVNLRAVDFPALEFNHRLVLHAPIPEPLHAGTYTEGSLVGFNMPYILKPRELFQWHDGQRRAPLECVPQLKADDSYTLELHFRWLGAPDLACRLEECRLSALPPELGNVRHVHLGRFDSDHGEIIWRNLPFQRGLAAASPTSNAQPPTLVLSVTFANPILHQEVLHNQPEIAGSYRCSLDGLLSGMTLQPEQIWNALGRRAAAEHVPINIEQSSMIDGRLVVDVRRLSQEHEHALAERICYHSPIEDELIARVLRVLVDGCRVDLQRIEQALPRLDPAGTLATQLRYWDIIGRQYDLSRLSAVDVHIVISGYDHMVHGEPDAPHVWIDLRARCLSDPRDHAPEQRAVSLLDALAQQIRQELGPGIGAPSPTAQGAYP
jgi:hypothetical protein